jgi:ubiquinone/menaquinone biosynthesis C-methylase UbiE
MGTKRARISALGYPLLTPLYDPLMRALRAGTFQRRLVEQARIVPGMRVLDLGCGTGTLTLRVQSSCPGSQVLGLDADPAVLRIASTKARRLGREVHLAVGSATALSYADGAFDRVLCSLLLHHLGRDDKVATFREVRRVLRPGGEFHVADWGEPRSRLMRLAFYSVQLLDGFTSTADHVNGLLGTLAGRAGLVGWVETARYPTVFGSLCLFRAIRGDGPPRPESGRL